MNLRSGSASAADLAIVGTGPAGLTAAIAAAEQGAQVILFEQLSRPAVKLGATGGGRCNLTNTVDAETFMARFGREGRFMQPALAAMDASGLCAFMAALGVATYTPDGVGIYPKSDSAEEVRQALIRRVEGLLGVTTKLGARVTGLRLEGGCVAGLITDAGRYNVPRVILATGGKSYPELGATGSGYALAAQAGHAIVDPRPALVPLLVKESWPRACAGVSLPQARAWIDLPGQSRSGVAGAVLFTHTGLSGPAILDLSGDVAALLAREHVVPLRLAITPDVTVEAWLGRFAEWVESEPRKTVHNLLDQHLPASLARALAQEVGIGFDQRISEVSNERRRALAELLAAAPLSVIGTEGFAKAMVTRGGVRLKDVDPETLQSRIVRGLYFAGEILDLDGPCGGYNLQWAFSSGHLAGFSAGRAT